MSIAISPDAQYVALPSANGNQPFDGMQKQANATYVFRAVDLRTPVATIAAGPGPRTVGFDEPGKSFYGQSADKALVVFSQAGVKGKEYALRVTAGGDKPRRFYVHPDGKKLFVQAGGGLQWVVLP